MMSANASDGPELSACPRRLTPTASPKKAQRTRWSRWASALLAGGLLFTTCETMVRDAVVFGTRSYALNVLLDPENVLEAILGDTGLLDDGASADGTTP